MTPELEKKEALWAHERTYSALIGNILQLIAILIQGVGLYFLFHHPPH